MDDHFLCPQTNYTCSYHQVLHPPSTIMFCPVINEPASVVSKAVAPLRSSGNPILFNGAFSDNFL